VNLLKTITSPSTVLTGYWTLVSQDTTLLHGIWIALPNHRTVEPYLTSIFTGLSKQQYQDKSQGEYLSLLWRNTLCREKREKEEYSSLEVTDSDNNSIKESVEFYEPSFRTNLASESELLLQFQFEIRVAEEERGMRVSFSIFCLFVCVLSVF